MFIDGVSLRFAAFVAGWAISVPTSQSQSTPDIADRAKGFGLPGVIVDGNDVLAVRDAVACAAAVAREGGGPTLIECKTVRWERHSAFPSGKQTDPEAARRWRKADPIPRLKNDLAGLGIEEAVLAETESQAELEIRDAVEFAMMSPAPAVASVQEGIFAPAEQPLGISGWKKQPGSGRVESF